MFDLKGKLDGIVSKFIKENGTKEMQKVMNELNIYSSMVKRLKEYIQEDLRGKNIAIFGNGEATKELLYAIDVPKNLKCIIDKKNKEPILWNVEDIPVISLEELSKYQFDVVLIPTMVHQDEMKSELKATGIPLKEGQIVAIHEWLKEKGFDVTDEFFQYKKYYKYEKVNEIYCEFLESRSHNLFQSLIIGLLCIRDYSHALYFMQVYIQEQRDLDGTMFKLREEIENIFDYVRKLILNQKTNHVMMYLVDSLKQDEVAHMPLLQKIASENFSFEKLTTQYGSNRESIMTLLTGYQIIENELYKRIYFSKKDGALLPYLKEQGYRFNFLCSRPDFAYVKVDDLSEKCKTEIASELFFEGLCEMLRHDENTFNYMHTLVEMHPPFFNPLYGKKLFRVFQECTFEEFMGQYRSAEKYIDELIKFYYDLVKSETVTQIIVGDHGISVHRTYREFFSRKKIELNCHKWDREFINPACIISNASLGHGRNKNLVCNYHLARFIKEILEKTISKEELEEYIDEYIKLEMIPCYDKKVIDRLLSMDDFKWILGLVGIWTERDVYIKLENGEEIYYRQGNRKNLIAQAEYQEEIEKYRVMLENENGMEKILSLNRFDYHKEVLKNYQ